MCALLVFLAKTEAETLHDLQQDAEGDEEVRALPLLESLAALEAAWQGADQETVTSSSNSLSQHVAFALQPGEIYFVVFRHLPLGALFNLHR